MAKIRFSALKELTDRIPIRSTTPGRVSEIFGCDVLTIEKMRQYLSTEAFKQLEKKCKMENPSTAAWLTKLQLQ